MQQHFWVLPHSAKSPSRKPRPAPKVPANDTDEPHLCVSASAACSAYQPALLCMLVVTHLAAGP